MEEFLRKLDELENFAFPSNVRDGYSQYTATASSGHLDCSTCEESNRTKKSKPTIPNVLPPTPNSNEIGIKSNKVIDILLQFEQYSYRPAASNE